MLLTSLEITFPSTYIQIDILIYKYYDYKNNIKNKE